jgi:NADH-quinone oxidoreductase subunit J
MAAQILFWFFAALALLGGLGVVALREPIKSVLSLVATMLSLAVLFLLLSAQFVFIVQVIVYAGAVMVLFLFVVALLGPIRERATRRLRFHWLISVLAAAVFLGFLWSMLQGIQFRNPQQGDPNLFGTVEQIGAGLFGPYLYPFELTSILLVVAAVGAIYLSRGGREQGHPNGRGPRPERHPRRMDKPERVEAAPTAKSEPGVEEEKEKRRA